MKLITITVEVDGNAVTRSYNAEDAISVGSWNERIEDMLDTIEKSNEKEF